jgi:hypothetical protein
MNQDRKEKFKVGEIVDDFGELNRATSLEKFIENRATKWKSKRLTSSLIA